MPRRKRSYLEREFLAAKRAMRPNRVTARFASGGRHQTWGAIFRSTFKSKTVHTPKTGRKAYEARMRKERQAQSKAAAAQRRQTAADQKAARTQLRRQEPKPPRPPRPSKRPVVISPRTGQPITLRDAQREVRRIEAELAGRRPRPVKPEPPTTGPIRPSLAQAIADVQKQQGKKSARPRKSAAKPKPASGARRTAARKQSKKKPTATDRLTQLLPDSAFIAQPASGRTTPAPSKPKPRARRPQGQRGVYGTVVKHACACGGTGRIPVLDEAGNPHGSTSCPEHGRAGAQRGAKRWTAKGAIRDSGLPGLGARLVRKRDSRRGNSDRRQARAADTARRETRLAGPTLPCEWCQGGITIPDRKDTDRDRAAFIAAALAAAEEGKAPSKRKLEKQARRAYPYPLCSHCKGLGRVATNATLLQDGRQPVAEWRATAGLREGHRLTAREQSTGKRMSKNSWRVEKRRKTPRL